MRKHDARPGGMSIETDLTGRISLSIQLSSGQARKLMLTAEWQPEVIASYSPPSSSGKPVRR
jgi:hypothetical protein